MITKINEFKTLTKHISCDCRCTKNNIQIESGIKNCVDVSAKSNKTSL